MSYFNDPKNVQEYIKMAEGFDGRKLIDILTTYLTDNATVLELGMGPGKDLDILKKTFKATGSDYSQVFLDLYLQQHPDADVICLDAVAMDTERKFDCIYSNKILHHLSTEEMHGLRFVYYTEATLLKLVGEQYEFLEMARYKEMEEEDSFYAVMRKNSPCI